MRDDIRTMHEAYQYLAKKYTSDKERIKEKQEIRTSEIIKLDDDELDKKDARDEVFGIDTVVAINKAAAGFKDQLASNKVVENEDNNNSTVVQPEQTVNQ